MNHKSRFNKIWSTVNKATPNKALDLDEISNLVLQQALSNIEQHLQTLIQASLNVEYFSKAFKETTTIGLQKSRKLNYTALKVYRLIALENTIRKIFESIIADIISYLTEVHELLPKEHFGGRPDRSTEDATVILSENIYKA